MDYLEEVIINSKKNMSYKELDFFEMLSDKEKNSLFYPSLIINLASYKNYPVNDARQLALLAQLLYYSIEIHEKILLEDELDNLVILEGDYLFSVVFKMITSSVHIKDIKKFTEFIKNFSEKRIMHIDGVLNEKEVLDYKYTHISKIVVEIISENDLQFLQLSEELTVLYVMFLKDDDKFESHKMDFLDKQSKSLSSELYEIVLKIVNSIGRVYYE